jgi:hypothetical protein
MVHPVDGAGANLVWPKPFLALAVMCPLRPVVRSRTSTRSPCGVSWTLSEMRSPWLMNSAMAGSGAPEATGSNCSGLGGPCGRPSLVM